jgi:DNA-binding LytR/AlgR family response regulator
MEQINCVITDDEPIARDIVLNYCNHLPFLKVIAICSNALEAKAVLQKEKVDLIFLDINMPLLDGISFIKTLRQPPQIIFTTAYKEYALNAFEVAAVDYLLKPFSLDRFMMAVDKALERMNTNSSAVQTEQSIQQVAESIFIRTENKIYRVLYKDILYAEASGNYIKVICRNQTLMPLVTISNFEEQLPASMFVRIHRSYIININCITLIEGNRVFVNNIELPIGSSYKEQFLKTLKI